MNDEQQNNNVPSVATFVRTEVPKFTMSEYYTGHGENDDQRFIVIHANR